MLGPYFLPIWLIILNAMSNCITASMYWNKGLISLLGRGMCTAKTMSLASRVFARGSSKLWIWWHWLDPQGMSHSRVLWRLMHLVAKERMAVVGVGAMGKPQRYCFCYVVQVLISVHTSAKSKLKTPYNSATSKTNSNISNISVWNSKASLGSKSEIQCFFTQM